jgi:hypothetical protein
MRKPSTEARRISRNMIPATRRKSYQQEITSQDLVFPTGYSQIPPHPIPGFIHICSVKEM